MLPSRLSQLEEILSVKVCHNFALTGAESKAVGPEVTCWYVAGGQGNQALDRNMKSYRKRERKIRLGSALHQSIKQATNNLKNKQTTTRAESFLTS